VPVWLLLLSTPLAAQQASGAPGSLPEPVVVVLSWDGVRHDYPDRAPLPALERMASDGVRAGRLVPVFPSSTFPGHVSLATGTYPDRHGIVDNHFIDAEGGRYRMSGDADWIQAEPLWIAAERQGVPAATYFWVGSESDWRGQGTRYRIAPFDGKRPEAQKVDQILDWLALPPDQRPRLVMSYWAGTDHEGHDHGPDSDAVTRQLQRQDAQLGRLLSGVDGLGAWPYTTLIVVSDHGMTDIGRYLDISGTLRDAGVAAQVTGSSVANVYLDDPDQLDQALGALSALQPVEVYRREAVPERLRLSHPSRTGDLVAITEPPNSFSRPAGMAGYLRSWLHAAGMSFGGHGYDPRHPDMGGVFLALGRGVPKDLVLPEVHQVDLAPTVARLLRMEPPRQSEGRPVRGIGDQLISGERPAEESAAPALEL
jgi:predicted AlkP superfamily pyrophosphatase or phosphodiesterase